MTPPDGRGPGDYQARVAISAGICVLLHVAVGTAGLFVVFLLAYGFAEEVTVELHVVFLLGVAMVAGLSALLATAVAMTASLHWRAALGLGASTALFAYSLALACGTVVSLLNEDQGSVTADQPTWPFVMLAVVLVVGGVLGGRFAVRVVRAAHH